MVDHGICVHQIESDSGLCDNYTWNIYDGTHGGCSCRLERERRREGVCPVIDCNACYPYFIAAK